MEIDDEEQPLVNGALMKKYIGRLVRIWINIGKTSTGGHKIQGTTADNKTISIALSQPLNQPLFGWTEVLGSPISDGVINCSEIIVFQDDENTAEPFDQEAHNNIVILMDNMENFYETGSELF